MFSIGVIRRITGETRAVTHRFGRTVPRVYILRVVFIHCAVIDRLLHRVIGLLVRHLLAGQVGIFLGYGVDDSRGATCGTCEVIAKLRKLILGGAYCFRSFCDDLPKEAWLLSINQ